MEGKERELLPSVSRRRQFSSPLQSSPVLLLQDGLQPGVQLELHVEHRRKFRWAASGPKPKLNWPGPEDGRAARGRYPPPPLPR